MNKKKWKKEREFFKWMNERRVHKNEKRAQNEQTKVRKKKYSI